jgi:ParB-like chromosome segregation protein Spo0J
MSQERGWIIAKKSDRKKTKHDRRKKATNLSAREAVGKGPAPADQRTAPSYKVRDYAVDAIKVDVSKRRPVNPTTVKNLVTSVSAIGLRTPLTIRVVGGVRHLVAGLQRLEAVKALGWKTVPCVCTHGGEIAARKCQIAENLHRGELTKLERAEQTGEWLELTESEERISGKKVQKKRGRPESGDAKAARMLPISGKTADAKRKRIAADRKIRALDPVVKEAIIEAGLDDDAGKLKEIVGQKTTKAQLATVAQLKASSAKKKPSTAGKASTGHELPSDVLEREWKDPKNKKLRRAWKHASPEDRRIFVTTILKYTPKAA